MAEINTTSPNMPPLSDEQIELIEAYKTNKAMSENNTKILIRSLTNEQVDLLEGYKKKYGHNTNTKAILSMIDHYQNKIDIIDEQRDKIEDLERELSSLKADVRTFYNAFYILEKRMKD